MIQDIYFTIVDTENQKQVRVNFEFSDSPFRYETVKVSFPSDVSMCPQQLAELGHLLIALSKHDYDLDSVHELIGGYGFDCLTPAI